jgi:hypothetical protein
MDELKQIINAIAERAPGPGDQWFTVDMTTLRRVQWNTAVDPPLIDFIAEQVGIEVGSGAFDACIIRYDENGNPQFQLSKEAARSRTRKEIRRIIESEPRSVVQTFEPFHERVDRTTDRIMAVIEREG